MSVRPWSSVIVIGVVLAFLATGASVFADTRKKAPQKEFLVFGFLPMESPVSLFKRFAPLRDYLTSQIEKEIRLETAKDFPSFAQRTMARSYDIVFTAPHMALQALDSNIYEVAATFVKPLKSVIVVQEKSAVQNLQNLEGKTIATPPEQAIVTMVGKQYLSSNGIKAARFSTFRTHNAAYSAVLAGEVDAAIISNFIARKVISGNYPLKIVASSSPFPGIGILVARDLPETTKTHIKKALWGLKDLPAGKKILKTIAQPGYMQASQRSFEVLRPFVKNDTALSLN